MVNHPQGSLTNKPILRVDEILDKMKQVVSEKIEKTIQRDQEIILKDIKSKNR